MRMCVCVSDAIHLAENNNKKPISIQMVFTTWKEQHERENWIQVVFHGSYTMLMFANSTSSGRWTNSNVFGSIINIQLGRYAIDWTDSQALCSITLKCTNFPYVFPLSRWFLANFRNRALNSSIEFQNSSLQSNWNVVRFFIVRFYLKCHGNKIKHWASLTIHGYPI